MLIFLSAVLSYIDDSFHDLSFDSHIVVKIFQIFYHFIYNESS